MSSMAKKDFLPIILGSDENAYGTARQFSEAYGVRPLVLCTIPLSPTRNSKLFDLRVIPDFERAEVAHYFPEIFKVSADCRFGNCTHTHEPGCAVREAVEQHRISESRYTSYLSILDDSDPDKYRKPF